MGVFFIEFMKKSYFIKTFGCQMNHSDSERISGFLESKGYKSAESISTASLVIFNTCGVRQMAEDRVYGQVHNLKFKGQISNVKIVLTGCLANRKDVQKRLRDKVDLFCEIRNFPKEFSKLVIPSESQRTEGSNFEKVDSSTALRYAQNDNNGYLKIAPKHKNKFSAFVPIMTGCNNFCSYCVVPYARGREVSRPAEEIIKEVKSLIKKDCKEIILLGQNVNSYCDSDKNSSAEASAKADQSINFSKLLKKINAIPGNFWIQFISNHPKDVTDEMIETVAKCKKICECFHLPIQSGNDEIIRKMNRQYTAKDYLKTIEKIKKAYKKYKPNNLYAITSDIIVGFPGETKKQFLDSAEIMKKAKYDMVFFGQFSPRPDTAAWKMKDNVSKAEKVRREKYLNEILKKTSYENNKKYAGKVLEVLIEKQENLRAKLLDSKSLALGNKTYFGKTRTMKNVKISLLTPALSSGMRGDNLIGKIVRVKITKANIWNLEGKLI